MFCPDCGRDGALPHSSECRNCGHQFDPPCECPIKHGEMHTPGDYCGSEYKGFGCTRPPGHDGPHTACAIGTHYHPVESWENENEGG